MSHRKVSKLQGLMLKLINEAGIEGLELGQRLGVWEVNEMRVQEEAGDW
jgi:hypothetical protein